MIKVLSQLKTTKAVQYAYNYDEFPFEILKKKIVKKGKYKHYHEKPMTFDIETSKIPIDNDEHYKAFMYIWQICLEGNVVFGRRWEQLQWFLKKVAESYKLTDEEKIVVYVHNLSFEFQFMQDFFDFEDVFAMDSRSILTAKTRHFEFRCSYKLSNMNLAKFIENTPNTLHYKGVGDLDYETVRTPDTPLNEVELGYCYNDVLGLYECIIEKLKEDTLATIPLTSTGYVRRDCRKAMRMNKNFRKNFLKQKLDINQYLLLKECFRGGNTASNRYHTNVILEDVSSWDEASSYPFQMLARKYPMGKWNYGCIKSLDELHKYNDDYCTIARYSFKNIRIRYHEPIPYIPISKCLEIGKEREIYNGRVMNANYIKISLTNIDYDIIRKMYDYDDIIVEDFYYCKKDWLPVELRNVILYYFEQKSKLKGDKEHYYEYMKSKNKLNSIYGMTVTNILHQEVIYENGDYTVKEMSYDEMKEALEKYYKSRNSFLNYSWGVFVTAYARKELQDGIDIVGIDCVYDDTDSVKHLGNYDKEFTEYNEKLKQYCIDNDIKNYVDVGNKRFYLGLFEKEESYDRFVTMGAKKYAYEQDGKIGITVAGLSKKQGAEELAKKGGLNKFAKGEIFYNSGRTIAQYGVLKQHQITVDNCTFTTASYVAIINTTYTLGITDTMLEIIYNSIKETKENEG